MAPTRVPTFLRGHELGLVLAPEPDQVALRKHVCTLLALHACKLLASASKEVLVAADSGELEPAEQFTSGSRILTCLPVAAWVHQREGSPEGTAEVPSPCPP